MACLKTNIAHRAETGRGQPTLQDHIWSWDVTSTQRMVLLALERIGRRDGKIHVTTGDIAMFSGFSDRTVQAVVGQLMARRFVKRRLEGGRDHAPFYRYRFVVRA